MILGCRGNEKVWKMNENFWRQILSLNCLKKEFDDFFFFCKIEEKQSELELKFELTKFEKVLRIGGPLDSLLSMKRPSIFKLVT